MLASILRFVLRFSEKRCVDALYTTMPSEIPFAAACNSASPEDKQTCVWYVLP